MPDPTPEQQRAALEKAYYAECSGTPNFQCGTPCRACKIGARRVIATYLAATGREAEAEQVRRAGDG